MRTVVGWRPELAGAAGMSLAADTRAGTTLAGGPPGPPGDRRARHRPQLGCRLADRRPRHVRLAGALQDHRRARRLLHHRHVEQRPVHRRFRQPARPGKLGPAAQWHAPPAGRLRAVGGGRAGGAAGPLGDPPTRRCARRSPPRSPASLPPVGFDTDDFFSKQSEEEPRRPRPADLPSPFEQPEPGAYRAFEREAAQSIAFDDPFSLDPTATPAEGARPDRQTPASAADPFGFGAAAPVEPAPVPPAPAPREDRRPAAEARPSPAPWNLPDEPPAAPPPAAPPKKAAAPRHPARPPLRRRRRRAS